MNKEQMVYFASTASGIDVKNPFDNYEEAYQLMVKLQITVEFDSTSVWCPQYSVIEYFSEHKNIYAATSFAISRAAAEVGRRAAHG